MYFLKAQNTLMVGFLSTNSGCTSVFQIVFLTVLNYFGQPLCPDSMVPVLPLLIERAGRGREGGLWP